MDSKIIRREGYAMTAQDLLAYISVAIAVKVTPQDAEVPPREYYTSVIQGFKNVYDTLCTYHLDDVENYLSIMNGDGQKL